MWPVGCWPVPGCISSRELVTTQRSLGLYLALLAGLTVCFPDCRVAGTHSNDWEVLRFSTFLVDEEVDGGLCLEAVSKADGGGGDWRGRQESERVGAEERRRALLRCLCRRLTACRMGRPGSSLLAPGALAQRKTILSSYFCFHTCCFQKLRHSRRMCG